MPVHPCSQRTGRWRLALQATAATPSMRKKSMQGGYLAFRKEFASIFREFVVVLFGFHQETEMVLCEVEIYGSGIYHDEENDCKICPYGKYQDERGQDDVKVVPKPMVQDIELTVDEESFVNFPALQCSHEWNAQTSPAVYPLHMSSMPWNVDITYVDARPKNDPNAARLRISRPGTLENAESVQNGGISYGYLNLWDEMSSLIMKQVVLPQFLQSPISAAFR